METTLIFFSTSDLKISTARNILAQVGIESFVINKKDSVYPGIFGRIELHVRKEDEDSAKTILSENEVFA